MQFNTKTARRTAGLGLTVFGTLAVACSSTGNIKANLDAECAKNNLNTASYVAARLYGQEIDFSRDVNLITRTNNEFEIVTKNADGSQKSTIAKDKHSLTSPDNDVVYNIKAETADKIGVEQLTVSRGCER